MDVARLVAYAIGTMSAFGVAMVLLRSKHKLGYMLSVTMFAWAFNCFSFGLMLVLKMVQGSTPDIASALWTVNAALLALVPIGLYVDLWGNGNGNGRDPKRG